MTRVGRSGWGVAGGWVAASEVWMSGSRGMLWWLGGGGGDELEMYRVVMCASRHQPHVLLMTFL